MSTYVMNDYKFTKKIFTRKLELNIKRRRNVDKVVCILFLYNNASKLKGQICHTPSKIGLIDAAGSSIILFIFEMVLI